MNLKEYLFRKQIKLTELARRLDMTYVRLSKIVNHTDHPSILNAIKIIHACEGYVTPEDLYPELFKAQKKAWDNTLNAKELELKK